MKRPVFSTPSMPLMPESLILLCQLDADSMCCCPDVAKRTDTYLIGHENSRVQHIAVLAQFAAGTCCPDAGKRAGACSTQLAGCDHRMEATRSRSVLRMGFGDEKPVHGHVGRTRTRRSERYRTRPVIGDYTNHRRRKVSVPRHWQPICICRFVRRGEWQEAPGVSRVLARRT